MHATGSGDGVAGCVCLFAGQSEQFRHGRELLLRERARVRRLLPSTGCHIAGPIHWRARRGPFAALSPSGVGTTRAQTTDE